MNDPKLYRTGSILLADYSAATDETDVLEKSDINRVLQGLYGEVGGIMSAAKKLAREGAAFPGYIRAAQDEFGDTLWYLAALCRRLALPLDEIMGEAANSGDFRRAGSASDIVDGGFAHVLVPTTVCSMDTALFKLGRAAAGLLIDTPGKFEVVTFARAYLDALRAANLIFSEVAHSNLRKARGAFVEPAFDELEDFDEDFPLEEQLPRKFKIRINQRASGRSYLQWNGVFIGDSLTDNIADEDGYRFHDVFHLAHAAILHWSPVVRALVKQKRKSRPDYDEQQDSGRAIVVEEGLTSWIFAKAKELDFFAGQKKVSLGILKTIEEFVSGYEVARCPLKLWERAILDGYSVFRQVREAEGGWIIGDRSARTLQFQPLQDSA